MTRTNKYRGTCLDCYDPVAARKGSLIKVGSKWVILCRKCAENGAPVALQYDSPAGDNAHDRILNWCRSSSAPKNAGMRSSTIREIDTLGNRQCIVRDVASWGDGRLENGDPNPQVYFAMAATWPEVEELLIERYPRLIIRENESSYTRFSGGAEIYTNRAGRCEDAPCCGCCS